MSNSIVINQFKQFSASLADIESLADYLGYNIEKIESIKDSFGENKIFAFKRPNNLDGLFAYVSTQKSLTAKTQASRFKSFFEEAAQAMTEKDQTSAEVDFIIVIGESIVIIFDSSDYRRRLILTPDKLSRDNSKYLDKLESLKSTSLLGNYGEEDFFGLIQLDEKFKIDLFRFAIADDEQFINKTRAIRLNFLKRIQDKKEYQYIIKDIFFQDREMDKQSSYYAEITSAILDTLVLRYILVRILEGRFGYESAKARKSVVNIGLGTSLDEKLESRIQFNTQILDEALDSKNEQLSLFDIAPDEMKPTEVSKIREEHLSFMENVYGGDLYVSDIAKAATKIEKTLDESEYALGWRVTSSTNLDFDLGDVTPGTIGEQYEQTLKMNLTKDEQGKWEYSKDNSQQREQGAFYTNAQITDYIIDITLGKKLSEISNELYDARTATQRIKILKNVLKIKMADISSGGGTFLAGAVRKLGSWYTELTKLQDIKPLLLQVKQFKSINIFQKYAVRHMIYGIDVDLKALIVSSFALTLESLNDEQDKLPELVGKNLINQNSVVSLVPENIKHEWFDIHKEEIKELYSEKKKWLSKKGNHFVEVKTRLQQIFADMASDYLKSQKYTKKDLKITFHDKHMEVLEFNLPEVFFDEEGNYDGGFDIIFGNPPYIRLQKTHIFSEIEKYIYKQLGAFKSYEATGDIYGLFFERATHLLKPQGFLGFITSNKYLRAGYGKSLRNYLLEKTNPYLLVNLGSGMFGATVDTSILALENSSNKDELQAIDLVQRAAAPQERLKNMSDYVKQNKLHISFKKDESWLILSPIEQSIKQKIEAVGTPLKDWNIRINRGILTGYNEAFIIGKERREELIAKDSKSAEIIRPILRGKDIKRYSYKFADKYLITTYNEYTDSNNIKHATIDINKYPSIKEHLDQYWEKISKRQDKGDTPYNLRRCAYMDDFSKPKIVFSRISGDDPCFAFDNQSCMINDTAYMIIGDNIDYLLEKLCSPEYWFAFKRFYMGGGIEKEFKVNNLENLPIPLPDNQEIKLSDEEKRFIYLSVRS